MLSVGSKTPQLSIELSTSDEHTPGSTIQLYEIIGLNVSIAIPEVSTMMHAQVVKYQVCAHSCTTMFLIHTIGTDLFTDCRTQSNWDVIS